MKRLVTLAALAAVLAGCGGGGGHPADVYSMVHSRECLRAKGLKTRPATDFVASTASGGAFRTFLENNDLTVLFGSTPDEGVNLAHAYERFHAKNVGIKDVLFRQGNAVMLWHYHPSSADLATISNCLNG